MAYTSVGWPAKSRWFERPMGLWMPRLGGAILVRRTAGRRNLRRRRASQSSGAAPVGRANVPMGRAARIRANVGGSRTAGCGGDDRMVDVTTFEVELEREKTEKIAQVAARGAKIAAELGQDRDAVQMFLQHYFRHVVANDVDECIVENFMGLVERPFRATM